LTLHSGLVCVELEWIDLDWIGLDWMRVELLQLSSVQRNLLRIEIAEALKEKD